MKKQNKTRTADAPKGADLPYFLEGTTGFMSVLLLLYSSIRQIWHKQNVFGTATRKTANVSDKREAIGLKIA